MQLYTDDVDALRRTVARENRKDIALDYLKQQARQESLSQKPNFVPQTSIALSF
jgi:hypothetical protein